MIKRIFFSNKLFRLSNVKYFSTEYGFKREIVASDFITKKDKKKSTDGNNNSKKKKKINNNEGGKELFWPKYGNSFYDPHSYSKKK